MSQQPLGHAVSTSPTNSEDRRDAPQVALLASSALALLLGFAINHIAEGVAYLGLWLLFSLLCPLVASLMTQRWLLLIAPSVGLLLVFSMMLFAPVSSDGAHTRFFLTEEGRKWAVLLLVGSFLLSYVIALPFYFTRRA